MKALQAFFENGYLSVKFGNNTENDFKIFWTIKGDEDYQNKNLEDLQ